MNAPHIITHNSRFHSDDVFGVAALLILFPEARVTRTRDPNIIKTGDIVLDVGGLYDEEKNCFDHHQIGGAGKRSNGVPYASFGLIWKKFGREIAGSERAAALLERNIVQPIDAMDNGVDLYTSTIEDVHPYLIQNITFAFDITWKEDDAKTDTLFLEMVGIPKTILTREIIHASHFSESYDMVLAAYERSEDKRIIEIEKNYPWETILNQFKEPLYVVRPNVQDPHWKVGAVRDDVYSYKVRKPFPLSWAGKRDQALVEASGVPDAHFCHNGRFLVIARSREGALRLAQIAVET